ncbi:MAG TPA: hypothetical protein VGK19_15920 [Capsulimonadaceae bacterium]
MKAVDFDVELQQIILEGCYYATVSTIDPSFKARLTLRPPHHGSLDAAFVGFYSGH